MSCIKKIINNSSCYESKISLIRPHLLVRARSKIFNQDDAEDIVQNTLNIVLEKKSSYLPDGNFYGWVFKILHWQIMGYFTYKKRSKEDSSCYSEDSYAYSLQSVESKMPFDRILKKELHDEQMKILHDIKDTKMPPREKEFFEYQLKGWSKADIIYAMKFGKESSFYVYKRRVIQRLKNNSKLYK